MADVVGIGSTFIDYFFETDKNFLAKYDLKPEDDYLFNDKKLTRQQIFSKLKPLAKSPGGIAANTIAVLAHLDVKAGFVGVIGTDTEGNFWINNIKGVDKSQTLRIGKTSICACLLTNQGKNHTFLSKVNSQENLFFKRTDVSYFNNYKIIHIGPLISKPKEGIKQTFNLLKKIEGPMISFSPGIIYIAQGKDLLVPIFKKTDILFLNNKEMKYLMGGLPKNSSKKLLSYGIKIVVCTLGDKGAIVTTQSQQFYIPRINVPNIIDTTGAGDSFAAGFLFGILNKKDLKWSGDFASKTAAKSLQSFGLKWLK